MSEERSCKSCHWNYVEEYDQCQSHGGDVMYYSSRTSCVDNDYAYWQPKTKSLLIEADEPARFQVADAEAATNQPVEPTTQKVLEIQEGGDHYKKYKIQPIEFCYYNNIPAIEASVIKYTVRHRDKNGVEDINKAIHLLNILKDLEYAEMD